MTFLHILSYGKYLTKLLYAFMFNKIFVIVIVIVITGFLQTRKVRLNALLEFVMSVCSRQVSDHL